ncbi:hypothetical protein scyTo_0025262, partial [Scyliorhinus torazame]|nr:hypothetical protein [Scyliorhinus torazame]
MGGRYETVKLVKAVDFALYPVEARPAHWIKWFAELHKNK